MCFTEGTKKGGEGRCVQARKNWGAYKKAVGWKESFGRGEMGQSELEFCCM